MKNKWLVGWGLMMALAPAAAQEPPPSPVRFTEARQHNLRRAIELPGTVEARTTSVVASEVAGLVEELPAREGDAVRKGQPLAKLRQTSIELRLRAVEGQLREAQARLKLAERSLERARELFESTVISQQQLDDAAYERLAWQGRVDQLAAERARLQDDVDRSTIRAPFDGVVVSEATEMGQWLGVGDPVVELLSLNQLEVVVDVPERYFASLERGDPATVQFESLPDLLLEGTVSALIPRADAQARSFPVKVRLPSRNPRVAVGMLARVSFSAGEPYTATIVPKDAIVTQGAQAFLFVLEGDSNVKRVTIRTGAGAGAWVAVEEGVEPGEKVITRGNERLRPGQPVQGEPLEYELP